MRQDSNITGLEPATGRKRAGSARWGMGMGGVDVEPVWGMRRAMSRRAAGGGVVDRSGVAEDGERSMADDLGCVKGRA